MAAGRRALASATLMLAGCAGSDTPQVPEGARGIDHTLSILTKRPPQRSDVLRVLFYGQSISTRKWTDMAVAALQRRFPGTRLSVTNLAIGGHPAQWLERTVARDIDSVYPDLIVFHAYGDHHAYERIIRTMRSRTAAEIIVQTDHLTRPAEPLCDEGLHLAWTPPPGCRGHVWFRQNDWEQHMSGAVLPRLAREYGLALEDRRPLWAAYLRRHGLAPRDLLVDGVHPDAEGWRLMAKLWVSYMARAAAAYRGAPSTLVADLPAPSGPTTSVSIEGNRVELIADGPLDGSVQATIDGARPEELDGCWQTSRTTSVPGIPEWPMIRQVAIAPAVHRADRWTATITSVGDAPGQFAFSLSSARRGADGNGTGDADFASSSGDVAIAARDWTVGDARRDHDVTIRPGQTISWTRSFVCHDMPIDDLSGRRVETRYVVATGIDNGRHVLTLRLTPLARSRIRGIRVYRPPLAAEGAA